MVGLIVLLAAVASVLSYRAFETRLQRELRIAVLKRLAETFPQARIKVQRVSIESANKIAVHGLCIAALDNQRLRQIVSIERIELTGDLDIAHIIQERVAIHRIDVYRPQADLWKLSDGTWSLMALSAKCKPGNQRLKCLFIRATCVCTARIGRSIADRVARHQWIHRR